MRVAAFAMLALALLMLIGIIASTFQDDAQDPGATIGVIVASLIPLGIAVMLFRIGGRLRRTSSSTATGPSTPIELPPTVIVPVGAGTGLHSYLEPGEVILGQATGLQPEGGGFVAKTWMLPLGIAVVALGAFFGGFFVMLLIIGFVVRIIKKASKDAEAGGDNPAAATIAVTDKRVLGFSRKWWVTGPISPWFAYSLTDVTNQFVQEGESPRVTIRFNDDREVSLVVAKQQAIEMASAFRTAGL